jgi:hypothetical protein
LNYGSFSPYKPGTSRGAWTPTPSAGGGGPATDPATGPGWQTGSKPQPKKFANQWGAQTDPFTGGGSGPTPQTGWAQQTDPSTGATSWVNNKMINYHNSMGRPQGGQSYWPMNSQSMPQDIMRQMFGGGMQTNSGWR